MPLLARVRSLWQNVVHRAQVDRDLDDEVSAALDLLTDEHVRCGQTRDEARRAARIQLGGTASLRQQVRDARTGAWLDVLRQDFRYAARSLRRTPAFTLAAVATLAIGIGANSTIFTLLDAVLFKPLPVPDARELVALYERAPEGVPDAAGGTGRYLRFSYPRYERLTQALGSDGSLAAVTRSTRFIVRLGSATNGTAVRGQLISGNYFTVVGVQAARGRTIEHGDVRIGERSPIAVISDGFWKRALGGSASAIGAVIAVNGVPITVVGVATPGFAGLWTDSEADLWLPLSLQQDLGYSNNASSYDGADRTRPWVSDDRIAWLNLIARIPRNRLPATTARLTAGNALGLQDMTASFADPRVRRDLLTHTLGIQPLSRGFSGLRAQYSDALLALGGIVAVLLLVTCANLASLMLARAAGRARDVSIRLSLGASSWRLVRQYLTESALLSAVGGAIGLLMGTWASSAMAHEVLGTSRALPTVFSPDSRVVLFAAAVSAASAILFGLAPALRAVAAGRSTALTATERHPSGRAGVAGMRPLVATQLGLAVVVVFAAALLGRTLLNYVRIDPGFELDRVVSTAFDAQANGYARSDVPALAARIVTAAGRVPGVRSAAVSTCGLVANCTSSSGMRFEGQDAPASVQDNWVGPQYFTTVGIPLIDGREFEERDTAISPRVAIVSESIARRYFGTGRAIGRRLGFSALDTEIIGVVRDARSITLHAPPAPMVYFPITQPAGTEAAGNLDVRVDGPVDVAAASIGGAIRAAAPGLTFDTVAPMRARVARDVARERLVAYLAAAFALLTLFLSSLGLYGVLSYAVTRRTAEIGVRMALGAGTRQVAGLVLKDAARVVLAGALLGLAAAFGAGRLLRTLLFDVSAADPATALVAVVVLVAVALGAAYLPVRRAARVDPITALRAE